MEDIVECLDYFNMLPAVQRIIYPRTRDVHRERNCRQIKDNDLYNVYNLVRQYICWYVNYMLAYADDLIFCDGDIVCRFYCIANSDSFQI